jgi:two-component system, OmpR family, osmolarity sensor histidine kinase EnvZ
MPGLEFKLFKTKKLKLDRFLPKSLFARSLLILLTPLILVQIVLGYIFFDRHTETILRQVSSNIAGDIALVVDLFERDNDFERLKNTTLNTLGFDLSLEPNEVLNQAGLYKKTWLYQFLGNALEEKVHVPYFVRMTHDFIFVKLATTKGVLTVSFLRKRLFSRTTPLVLIWTTTSALLLFLVASIFMRNQIRPIRQLSEAAERFGKGDESITFNPRGATEVRKAGFAFQVMRDRIKRHLSERLESLAGVSHDLRTPLTRMRLQLALMPETDDTKALQEDIKLMSQMVEGFLVYAQGTQDEPFQTVYLADWLEKKLTPLQEDKFKINITCPKIIKISIKESTFNRCLTNLVVNSRCYASKVEVFVQKDHNFVEFYVDDDGPGIPLAERENVFKPFYRLDQARNLDKGGVGLGLNIARDCVRSHGGQIYLRTSPLGGLRVIIRLPI